MDTTIAKVEEENFIQTKNQKEENQEMYENLATRLTQNSE